MVSTDPGFLACPWATTSKDYSSYKNCTCQVRFHTPGLLYLSESGSVFAFQLSYPRRPVSPLFLLPCLCVLLRVRESHCVLELTFVKSRSRHRLQVSSFFSKPARPRLFCSRFRATRVASLYSLSNFSWPFLITTSSTVRHSTTVSRRPHYVYGDLDARCVRG